MKILIIAPYFAPLSTVAAQRMGSLSRVLLDNKHDVTVLAQDESDFPAGFSKSIPPAGIKIIRFKHSPKYKSYFITSLVRSRELRAAIRRAMEAADYDIILCTLEPTESEYGVYKELGGKKYVLDFRDFDIMDMLDENNKKKPLYRMIKKFLFDLTFVKYEKKAIKGATHIVTVGIDDDFREMYRLSDDKVSIIYNGYDDRKLTELQKRPLPENVFYLGYFGKLMYYHPTYASNLFEALDRLQREGYDARLIHIGDPVLKPDKRSSMDMDSFIKEKGWNERVYQYLGVMDYRAGMETLLNTSINVVENVSPTKLGTKLYDYIFLNKPIILLDDGSTVMAQKVKEFHNSLVSLDAGQIAAFIKSVIASKTDTLDPGNSAALYARSRQNQRYLELLEKLTQKEEDI